MSLASYRNIVVLTGAGISQAAGLPTYRGPGGVWNDPEKIALADVNAMRTRRREACAMLCSGQPAGVRWRCDVCGAGPPTPAPAAGSPDGKGHSA